MAGWVQNVFYSLGGSSNDPRNNCDAPCSKGRYFKSFSCARSRIGLLIASGVHMRHYDTGVFVNSLPRPHAFG